MSYNVEFKGQWELNNKLQDHHRLYLIKFSEIRHIKRDVSKLELMPDELRLSVNLPIGTDGEFFVGGSGDFGQEYDSSILHYNKSPITQPGLWNGWMPNSEGTHIVWDEIENFYNYIEWIKYIINNFLIPWNYILNGKMQWQGDAKKDKGIICIENNVINIQPA